LAGLIRSPSPAPSPIPGSIIGVRVDLAAADGLRASLTDANDVRLRSGFDRLATTTYPGGGTETFSYDADGNVLSRKTRANATIAFAYDTLNRLATKTPPAPAPVVSYTYDLASRLMSANDTSPAIAAALPPANPVAATSCRICCKHLAITERPRSDTSIRQEHIHAFAVPMLQMDLDRVADTVRRRHADVSGDSARDNPEAAATRIASIRRSVCPWLLPRSPSYAASG
jgi:YD repeat-containing protein